MIKSNQYKFILLDFYWENCGYCYQFQAEWNRLVVDLENEYGEDQLLLGIVDGPKNPALDNRYKVRGYPHFELLDV